METADALAPLLGQLQSLQQHKKDHPLAYARLWDRELPRTSQRRAFQQMGSLITIISGGNRAGKTRGSAMFSVAYAMGRGHPDAQRWCRLNGIDPTTLPDRPGTVWAIALDSPDGREYMRPAIAEYLPAGSKWRNRDGYGRAEVQIPGGGRIIFLSVAAGRESFQGSAVDLCWFDEEPGDEGVVNECLMRLVDRQPHAKLLLSMTPLRGMTWLHDRWVAQPSEEVRVHYIHGEDNPHLPEGALARLLRQYGPHERAARARGEWTTLEGRVYQDWARHLHVIEPHPIPEDWPIYLGMDFGTRAPTAVVVCALGPDDRLYLVDEYYKAQATLSTHAKAIHALIAKWGEPEWIVCDPEDRGARLALAREHGLANSAAKKGRGSVARGINSIAERLAPDVEGRPGLQVFASCTHFIREIESYVWDERGAGEALDQPKKRQADHLLDAVRYLVVKLGKAGGFAVG
jgi:phage terminase large subunit-like protein